MLKSYLNESKIHPAPLAVFRILFGSLMLVALLRLWVNGWIHTLYIEPEFHFKYYGFSWVTDFGNYTYLLYLICITATIGIILGYRYRLSIFMFFLLFTYTELIDKTTYLNHYYFTSCIAFLLCFLPAAHYFSLDALKEKKTIEMNFSAILIAAFQVASFAEQNVKLVKCLERTKHDLNLSYYCFVKAIKKDRKTMDRFYKFRSLQFWFCEFKICLIFNKSNKWAECENF